ncbi:hypothetical protein [Knoellia sp. LjRoot47]|uniref:hypothetical protein n=1 Tax=Knoellia sp. LjRoot47 TaxID=3342330 RepID=UPI003ECFD31A
MSVLFDYFAAPSDEIAAAVVDRDGGPAAQHGAEGFDTVTGWGIDPVVQLGTLESLLTGRSYDEVVEDARSGQTLAVRDGGERLVLAVTDGLTAALVGAGSERLASVAPQWSQTEEFWGGADPADLAEFLDQLSALAERASESGQRIYCWVCV